MSEFQVATLSDALVSIPFLILFIFLFVLAVLGLLLPLFVYRLKKNSDQMVKLLEAQLQANNQIIRQLWEMSQKEAVIVEEDQHTDY